MGFAKFPVKSQLKVQMRLISDQVVVSFGNGYEEILNKDPHGGLREYNLSYTHLTSTLLPIINFLEEHSDGTPFIFEDPNNKREVVVYIKGGTYNVVKDTLSQSTVSCTLRETRRYAN